jgi:hypothetical protein
MAEMPHAASMTMPVHMPMMMTHRAALMTHGAIPKNGAAMPVTPNDHAFAIHRRATGTAVVREAAI